jgi:hypothetical protein
VVDWTPFLVTVSAAAATLAGLLFVAVQLNIDALVNRTGSRWFAVARSTYTMYTLLLLVPLVLVLPGTDPNATASVLILAAVAGGYGAIRTWFPVWRGFIHHQERLWQSFWLLFSPLSLYVLLGWNGYQLFNAADPKSALRFIGYILIALFSIALRNSWRILVEVSIERRAAAAQPPNQSHGQGKP